MQYNGKVVAKIQQEGGPSASFARIQVGSKKSDNAAKLRFFDIPDQDELILGDKVLITITRAPKQPAVIANIQDWSQCCVCNPSDKPGHYCADHIPQTPPGGCVSVSDWGISEGLSVLPKTDDSLTINGWYKCGGCGVDLSKYPVSASAHVCPPHFDRVPEGDIPNVGKKYCV
jgi:hypothetical protein